LKFGLAAIFTTSISIKCVDLFTRASATKAIYQARGQYHDRAVNRLLSGNNWVETAYESGNHEVVAHQAKAMKHRQKIIDYSAAIERIAAKFSKPQP